MAELTTAASAPPPLASPGDGRPGSGPSTVLSAASTAGIMVLALAAVARLAGQLRQPTFGQDEGLLLEYPRLLDRGWWPLVDYDATYVVGNTLLLRPAYALLGWSISAERAVSVVELLVTAAAVLVIGRRLRGWAVAAACVLALTWSAPALAWQGAVMLAAVGIAVATGRSRSGPSRSALGSALGSALVGAAASLRVEWLPITFLITGLFCWYGWSDPDRRTGRLVTTSLLGWGIGVLPGLVNLVLLGPARGPDWLAEQTDVRKIASVPWGVWVSPGSLALAVAFLAIDTVALAALVTMTLRRREAPSGEWRSVLAWLLLLPLAAGELLQRNDEWHADLSMVITGPMAVLVLALVFRSCSVSLSVWAGRAGLLSDRRRAGPLTWRAVATGAAVGLVMLITLRASTDLVLRPSGRTSEVCGRHTCVLVDQRTAPDLTEALVAARASGRHRLFVGQRDLRTAYEGDVLPYLLLERSQPCTPYLEAYPAQINGPRSSLTADLAGCDLVLLKAPSGAVAAGLLEFARPYVGPDSPNQVMRREFALVFHNATWSVYVRRPRA